MKGNAPAGKSQLVIAALVGRLFQRYRREAAFQPRDQRPPVYRIGWLQNPTDLPYGNRPVPPSR